MMKACIDTDEYSASKLLSGASLKPWLERIEHAEKTSAEAGLPEITVTRSHGRFFQIQMRLMMMQRGQDKDKPFNVLEVGGLGGVSAIWFASAGPNVRITSVEYDKKHVEIARANLEHAGLSDRVEVIHGAGLDILPGIKDEIAAGKREAFDFVFVDADKPNNWNYFDMGREMSKSGAFLVVDNVARYSALVDEEKFKRGDGWAVGSRKLVEEVGRDERVESVLILNFDDDWDGWLFALKL